jgi:prepilin signal peptidase PulO-like enzyme (type II secretory pathway)
VTEPAVIASALPKRRRVALAAALVVVPLAPLFFGTGAAALVGGVFLAVLAVLAVKDLEERRIPNAIVLPAAALVFGATALLRPDHALESFLAAVGAALFFLVPGLLSRGGVGMGDVKLALLLGAALGRGIVPALLLGCLAASAVGVFLLVRHGAAARRTALPFAPFLALGAIAALALGAPHAL